MRRYILEELRRGASVIHSEGAYTGRERPIVMSLLLPRQVADLKTKDLLDRRYERLQSYGRFSDTKADAR